MLTLGIDPDLHNTAVALVRDGRVEYVEVIRVDKKLKDADAVKAMCIEIGRWERNEPLFDPESVMGIALDALVVEGQELYRGQTGNPADILRVGQVAGAAVGCFSGDLHYMAGQAYLPQPKEWKGNVPKKIHQARICKRLNWPCDARADYVVPRTGEVCGLPDISRHLKAADWKHVMDAIGLALWGEEQALKAERRRAA